MSRSSWLVLVALVCGVFAYLRREHPIPPIPLEPSPPFSRQPDPCQEKERCLVVYMAPW